MYSTAAQSSGDWVKQQTAELLALIPTYTDETTAARDILEHAAEALEAEIGAVIKGSEMMAAVGFSPGDDLAASLVAATADEPRAVEVNGVGSCRVVVSPIGEHDDFLVLARSGYEDFSHFERGFIRSVTRVLVLAFRIINMVDEERALRHDLEERQHLLEKLSRIQRSISHRAPLQEVLDSITAGARELLEVEVSGLRLIDPDDPDWAILVSCAGITAETLAKIKRSPLSEGAGGRAILEQRLYLLDSYEDAPEAIPYFASDHLQSAMAAPVFEEGDVVGSLVVATYDTERSYGASEQEMLLALAEHASLALTDAKTLESMREAQRAKDMFLAMVSHELKTPLTVIMGTLQTFRAHLKRLPDDLRDEMLRASYERGRDLEHLIDMLLKGARAELAGVKQLSRLKKVIQRAVRGFDSSREVTVAEVPDVTLFVDDLAVHQIVGILLENAVSHSEDGTKVAVTTRVANDEVSIDVLNQGMLPDDLDQARLFLPFERGKGVRSSGVGLGLHIASRLAESVLGRLEVESRDGYVRFTLVFPLEGSPKPDVPVASAPDRPA